jgi:hypothetical protein
MRAVEALGFEVIMSVWMSAGAMAFAVIPSLASNEAWEWVRPIKPALEAAYKKNGLEQVEAELESLCEVAR